MEIGNLIHFLYDMGDSVIEFSLKVFEFMSYEIPIVDITVGSCMFGVGISVYLGYQVTTWALNLIT